VVLIGHAGHPEVEGTMGQWQAERRRGRIYLVEDLEDVAAAAGRASPDNLAYTTQTTLSVDDTRGIIEALRAALPAMQGPRNDDICYATQNRQDAVRALARSATWCWWSARSTAPIPTACANWPSATAWRPT
jgi:4-hydroxy-3-methylbut-2-en-1-yl diphosphate reductase